MAKFRPVAMRVPGKEFVYAPSELRPVVQADIADVADTAKSMKISLHDDGVSNPQNITTYQVGHALNGRHILEKE